MPETLKEYQTRIARLGGEARAKKLSPARRKAIARKAVKARWADEKRKAAS